MNLLFDQNISHRILNKVKEGFPEAQQVRALGLENATDREIWNFAKENGFCIVTFDADFFDLSTLYGHPPKIIWLRTGNTTTQGIADLIHNNLNIIGSFLNDIEYEPLACLELE